MERPSTTRGSAIARPIYLLLMLLMPAASAADELPREFTANYALEIYGTVMARATYTLQHTDNGVTMTQSTRPAGLAALLRDDKIDIRSDMVVNDGRLLLVNYHYTHTGDDKDRDVRFKIDWQAGDEQALVGKATGVYEGRDVDIVIDSPVWDPLSIQVPIMLGAGKNLPPRVHGLFMKGEFRHYLFEIIGRETVEFKGAPVAAVKLAGRETHRDRAMYVWVMPDYHNIPAKIEQWKNGELKSTVRLSNVDFNEDGRTRAISLKNAPSSSTNLTVKSSPYSQSSLALR
jgi:hypothetical protein